MWLGNSRLTSFECVLCLPRLGANAAVARQSSSDPPAASAPGSSHSQNLALMQLQVRLSQAGLCTVCTARVV